jgi:hypothetical protein
MSYYGSNHYTANHYASQYYGPRGTVVVEVENTGGIGSYRDKQHQQNLEDEYVLELVFQKFTEVVGYGRA